MIAALSSCPVFITSNAVKELQRLQGKCPENVVVRIGIDATGISGVHPTVEFDQVYHQLSDKSDYHKFIVESLNVVIQSRWLNYLVGLRLDFHEGLDRSGFVFAKG
jgi:Fe-S cluster assembly iron-binding protein IscA